MAKSKSCGKRRFQEAAQQSSNLYPPNLRQACQQMPNIRQPLANTFVTFVTP